MKYRKLLTGMQQKSPFTWLLYWKLPIDTLFHPVYMSISPVLWHNCQRVFLCYWPSARHAGRIDCLMNSLILIAKDNGRGLCTWWQFCKVPNKTHRKIENCKIYAIKQIKTCAEYRDMLPRPRLDLSGAPGLRPIGLSPGSWQPSLGQGSMSRYSAHILIYIMRGNNHPLHGQNGQRVYENINFPDKSLVRVQQKS